MKNYVYEEFIQYNDKFTKGKNDFYGADSPLSQEEQKIFLAEHFDYHKKRFGENAAYQYAVLPGETAAAVQSLCFEDKKPLKFEAYTRKKYSDYKNWQFYTDRVSVRDNIVTLSDNHQFPVPCAKYELPQKIRELSFRVKIGGGYYHRLPGGILPNTQGRYIELRQGCAEVVKLFFSPDGTLCYKDGSKKKYHYELTKISKYCFDEWNEIKIALNKDNFVLTFGGKEHIFGYTVNTAPDNLFLGGGMQPIDDWSFGLISCTDDDGTAIDFFVIDESRIIPDQKIGEAVLPYAIGTQKYKDCSLVLKSDFECVEGFRYLLNIDALDPGGEIIINGKTVVHKDDFHPFSLDITRYKTNGMNTLEIVVFPRAPEVLYPWHRHDDFYNGWFCLGASITECRIAIPSPIEVWTDSVSPMTNFRVKWAVGLANYSNITYKIFLQKVYPVNEKQILLSAGNLNGDMIEESFCRPVDLWEVEAPNLYKITVELYDKSGICFVGEQETGFRTIEQKNGGIYLNGKKITLKGALNMQFLPPYDQVPINHVCPSIEQIVTQVLAIKNMQGNCMRLHQLGYGCGDKRFAAVCDRLGLLLIWTTRLIDSVENMLWCEDWHQADGYCTQIKHVLNHPSIIIYEGSNELHASPEVIDRVYDAFVTAVKKIDTTRILSPVSHLYYDFNGCYYYNDDGALRSDGLPSRSSHGWLDKDVIRSAHTYDQLLGYGMPWQDMVRQSWKWQPELFDNSVRAYIVSEFAVIGKQNPNTPEAKKFINKDSYELPDIHKAFGFDFSDDEWELSQSYQALAVAVTTKQLRRFGADGMIWCCLWGGANNASYLKPLIDFYGYKKLAYYQMAESFAPITAFNETPDVLFYPDYMIKPVVCGLQVSKDYALEVEVIDNSGLTLAKTKYDKFSADKDKIQLPSWKPGLSQNGFYTIRYNVTEY